jgi:hypothetical protein
MPSSWRDIEEQLADYNRRRWQPAAWALGSILLMVIVGGISGNVGVALFIAAIGIGAAIALSATLGVRCPACRRNMNDLGARGASLLTLLVSLRQCPLCQHKFDDAA